MVCGSETGWDFGVIMGPSATDMRELEEMSRIRDIHEIYVCILKYGGKVGHIQQYGNNEYRLWLDWHDSTKPLMSSIKIILQPKTNVYGY